MKLAIIYASVTAALFIIGCVMVSAIASNAWLIIGYTAALAWSAYKAAGHALKAADKAIADALGVE